MLLPARFPVPTAFVPWGVDFPAYDPPLDDPDGAVPDGAALNPRGRTGLAGRGVLWRWGENPAADMVLTRAGADGWIQVLLIIRGDNGALALPGGFLEEGETSQAAALREGGEEAIHPEDLALLDGVEPCRVHAGVSGSRRNTDHAWIVSEGYHWHLPRERGVRVRLRALGDTDDAASAHWEPVTAELFGRLHGTHRAAVLAAVMGLLAGPGISLEARTKLEAAVR